MHTNQHELNQALNVLELRENLTWDLVQSQYRKLVQRWHPDRHAGTDHEAAQAHFIAVNSAYNLLRQHYRKTGQLPKHNAKTHNGPLLGTRSEPTEARHWIRNPAFQFGAAALSVLFIFAAVLWSLDTKIAKNNRDRARTVAASAANSATATLQDVENDTVIQHTLNEHDD